MNITLRTEQPADFLESERITREAFWNIYVSGCSEHHLFHAMRNSTAFMPELDIIALEIGLGM
jgi:predicted N-acetyltransferase YhbS